MRIDPCQLLGSDDLEYVITDPDFKVTTFCEVECLKIHRATYWPRTSGLISSSWHSSSERSERFVRFEPNVRSERVRYFSERETNVQALKRLINLIALK